MTVLKTSIEDELMKEVRKMAKELGIEESVLVKKALQDFLYLERVNKLRSQMSDLFEKKGYTSEEEIFDEIS